MKLHESGENYLENILILERQNQVVRSVDLAREMDFSKPSVSRAIHLLEGNGYLRIEDNGNLKLTERGRQIAEAIYERHTFLTTFLISLGVSEETASEDACRIEHVISEESFRLLKDKFNFCDQCPQANCDRIFCFNCRTLKEAAGITLDESAPTV